MANFVGSVKDVRLDGSRFERSTSIVTDRVHLPMLGKSPMSAASLAGPPHDPLLDTFARRIRYLRVSVTDRCNYRCTYCMPEELASALHFEPRSALLSFEELEQVVTLFARLGVRKIRLTGGEPTVRRGLVELVARLARIAGIEQVVMTTNGHLLAELAEPLARAGLAGVNVSLDTLDADRFRTVTGRGELGRVLAGIDGAIAAGLRVKTNAVALRDVNGDALPELCEAAWSRGAVPRFIEHMPMSDGVLYSADREISAAEIRTTLAAAFGELVPVAHGRDAGPARTWALARDPSREVGIISAMTEHFCDDCNRLRLTATGDLHACLGHDDALSLRDLLRAGAGDAALVAAIGAAVTHKRAGHTFVSAPPGQHMIGIGG
jgi:cyclic pyranopterin phosphate synthase